MRSPLLHFHKKDSAKYFTDHNTRTITQPNKQIGAVILTLRNTFK